LSGKFEWRTIDEGSWDELDSIEPLMATPGRRHWITRLWSRKYIAVLTILLLLILLGSRKILLRAEETNRQIKGDVLAAHDFLLQAVLDRDSERLNLVLSESDMQWRNLQQVIIRRSLFLDRGPFNLWLDEDTFNRQLIGKKLPSNIVLSPDLTTAKVTTTMSYLAETADGQIDSAFLNRVSHFTYDGTLWRQIPPTADYWGTAETFTGQMISVNYPAIDGEISRYIATALDAYFLALCRLEPAVRCASDPYIHLTFSTDPEAFLALSRPVQGNRFWIFGERMAAGDTFDISLPTPSLIGLPQTEKDRQILLNGYAGWLLTAYLTRKHPYLSFEHIDQLLQDLKLQLPPPVGYKPARPGSQPLLPVDRALLSCYGGDTIIAHWIYDFKQDQWTSLDPERCPGCELDQDSTIGLASSDGRFAINHPPDLKQRLVSHLDGRLLQEFSGPVDPVWLNENTFAFISSYEELPSSWTHPDAVKGEAVFITRLVEPNQENQVALEQIVSQQDLLSAVPEGRIIPALSLHVLLFNNSAPSQLLVLAGNGYHEQFLFKVNPESGEVVLVTNWIDNGTRLHAVHLTEHGRLLTVLRHSIRRSYLTLIDLANGQREIMDLAGRPLSRFAWSADEQWLLVADDRLLRLISPTGAVDLTFKHTLEDCTAVRWLDEKNRLDRLWR
jgi:hypothetical protein